MVLLYFLVTKTYGFVKNQAAISNIEEDMIILAMDLFLLAFAILHDNDVQ